jgi:hypothetical protein
VPMNTQRGHRTGNGPQPSRVNHGSLGDQLVGVSEHQVAGVQQHRPPSRRVSNPVAADFDGLGRDLTEILNDDTSALCGGGRIHPDAHFHRQLPVGARHCDLRDVQTPVRSLETLNQPPRRESMQNTVQS